MSKRIERPAIQKPGLAPRRPHHRLAGISYGFLLLNRSLTKTIADALSNRTHRSTSTAQ